MEEEGIKDVVEIPKNYYVDIFMAIVRHCYYEYKIPILEFFDKYIEDILGDLDCYITFDKVRNPIRDKEPDIEDIE